MVEEILERRNGYDKGSKRKFMERPYFTVNMVVKYIGTIPWCLLPFSVHGQCPHVFVFFFRTSLLFSFMFWKGFL